MIRSFKISFCGDTSLGYYYLERASARYPVAFARLQQQPESFFSQLLPALAASNEIIVNLEAVLSNLPAPAITGKQYPGRDKPDVFIPILKKIGVTAVMLANNHSMDFGADALLDMISQLEQAGIAVLGAGQNRQRACRPYIINHPTDCGKKIYIFNAMLANKRYHDYGFFASDTSAGVAEADSEFWADTLMQLRDDEPDATIIMCPHWQGIDYKPVTVQQQEWCREMVAVGADYIIAHGSHTADTIEQFGSGQIFYSIGNFVFNSPGRYQKLDAAPQSLIVSLVDNGDGWQSVAQNILTDNKLTDFQVRLVGTEQPVIAQPFTVDEEDENLPLSIRQWLDHIAADGLYFYQGDTAAPCAGFSSSFHDYRPDSFFVLRDDSWPREQHNQANKTLDEIVIKAKKLGYNNFVVCNAMSDALIALVPDANVLVIDNTFSLVKKAANFMRDYSQCRLIGITGSAGKSSTVMMMQQALALNPNTGELFVTKGKNRNLFQDSLHSLTKLQGANHAVLEVSASQKFDHHHFYVRPNIAIFTSLSNAHAESFGHIADIALLKSALFRDMPIGGTAIVNADMPCLDFVLMKARNSGAQVILYGESVLADVRLRSYNFATGRVEISVFGTAFHYNMGQLGKHQVLNSMAVLIALRQLGMNWQQHALYLQRFSPEAGKGEKIDIEIAGKNVVLLDESYNANPASMKASLELLHQYSQHHYSKQRDCRAIAVLADMLELGSQSEKLHRDLLKPLLAAGVSKVFLVGKNMAALWPLLPDNMQGAILPDTSTLPDLLSSALISGDIVLFKGSNAMKLSQVIAKLNNN
ncbi:CapA family protein [Rheinheimera maricola]|uniref:CapA family protein n=1 Tax=Rheinheimera maricola TaxID=2793282 RepID=A0ABS7XA75_9GAMM|nr:CapA family protein [Rheinheimera maricola]MBZ9612089.1 CapA family protein [Rheinheimera maricola]